MKKLNKAITVALLSLSIILFGSQKNDLDYEFIQDGNCYSFLGSFIVQAERDCLIHVIYDFEHISKYTAGAKSIELDRQGEDWYEVTYTYRKFLIFENSLILILIIFEISDILSVSIDSIRSFINIYVL